MHAETLERYRHDHHPPQALDRHETRTRAVVVLTAGMMIAELVVGRITHSLALTADGWHMASHAGALGLSALAYWFARTRSRAASFTFGTGKVYALAGYTSAVALAMVALWMLLVSVERLAHPEAVAYREALPIACVGLVVNLVSAWLLHGGEHGHDEHGHDEHGHDEHGHDEHGHGHQDHNLRAAYVHVVADALTSVLAIVALAGGWYAGWTRLDPLMGIVGGLVILRWSYGLCTGAGGQLLDVVPADGAAERIQGALEALDDVRVADLHVWELGPGRRGCVVSLVTSAPRPPEAYHDAIRAVASIEHVTVEVHGCSHGHSPAPAAAG